MDSKEVDSLLKETKKQIGDVMAKLSGISQEMIPGYNNAGELQKLLTSSAGEAKKSAAEMGALAKKLKPLRDTLIADIKSYDKAKAKGKVGEAEVKKLKAKIDPVEKKFLTGYKRFSELWMDEYMIYVSLNNVIFK